MTDQSTDLTRRIRAFYARQWREKNKEHFDQYVRDYYAKNRDRINAVKRERYRRKREGEES